MTVLSPLPTSATLYSANLGSDTSVYSQQCLIPHSSNKLAVDVNMVPTFDEQVAHPLQRTYPDITRILSSPPFTFLVGEEMEPVLVHSQAIAALSHPLGRLINGNMREATERIAELPDIGKEDFTRVCEFAYRGDYTAPKTMKFQDVYGKSYASSGEESDNESIENSRGSLRVPANSGKNDSGSSSYGYTHEDSGVEKEQAAQMPADIEELELEERKREKVY